MNKEVLRMALQFGNGTNLDPKQQTNMGKFGMGLPASSVSQARRLDVWSWQKGTKSALHTYLDIHEIEKGILDYIKMNLANIEKEMNNSARELQKVRKADEKPNINSILT